MAENTGKLKLIAWMGAAAAAASVTYTSTNEGTSLKVYRDPASILTACTGETHYIVQPGDIVPSARFTRDECTEALYRSMADHAEPVMRCTEGEELTTGQKIAFLDFTYNAGPEAFCKSSMAKHAQVGNRFGSCYSILKYRFINHGRTDCATPENRHVCGGIWTRRLSEFTRCLS